MTKVKDGGRMGGDWGAVGMDGWINWCCADEELLLTAITQQVQKSSKSLFRRGRGRSGFYTFHHSGFGGNNCSPCNKMMMNDCKGSGNAGFLFLCQNLRPLANKSLTITPFFYLKINPGKSTILRLMHVFTLKH